MLVLLIVRISILATRVMLNAGSQAACKHYAIMEVGCLCITVLTNCHKSMQCCV